MKEKFHTRLQRLRNQKDISVRQMAQRIDVPESTYREWEYGRQIKGEPYGKLAVALNVSLNELLTGKKDKLEVYLDQIELAVKGIKVLL